MRSNAAGAPLYNPLSTTSEKEHLMTRMKTAFAVLLLAAMASVVPQAHAATNVKVVIAGSSAMWQSLALAAYKSGKCVSGGTSPCFHYTAKNFNLADTRPTVKRGSTAVDTGTIWIVWDSNTTATNVWAYIKVDSVVGPRCYFAQPHCNVNVSVFPAPSNQISSTLWGDSSSDSTPPAAVGALFTSGTLFGNTAATDGRPEDGLFAQMPADSTLGRGNDGLAGLGYGVNAPGGCPRFCAALANLAGTDILSGSPGSTATAHPLAFNITGTDPFTNTLAGKPCTSGGKRYRAIGTGEEVGLVQNSN